MSEQIFQTQQHPKPNEHWRVTMTVEAHDPQGFEWAIQQAAMLGRDMMMGVSLHLKDDPLTRVSVRTTKMRKRKPKQ